MRRQAENGARLVLRADGNSKIGLGHIMRLAALAEILRSDFNEIRFLIQEPSPELIQQLTASSVVVEAIPTQPISTEAPYLVQQILLPTDVVVLDGYGFRDDYQKTIREAVYRLVYLDDLHAFPIAADLVINPAGGIEPHQYHFLQPTTRLLSGPAFAPLRAAFRESNFNKATAVETALVCLGGADPTHQTQSIATELLRFPVIKHLHLVVGSAFAQWESLVAWAQYHSAISLHRNLTGEELAELMIQCGTAVCSASTVSYEYCAAGGGLLFVLPVAENQHDIDHFLRLHGCALPFAAAQNVLTSPDVERIAMQIQNAQQTIFDGLSAVRLRQEFRALQLQLPPFQLRQVKKSDSTQLLSWTNDPVVRQYSFNSEPVALAVHEEWLSARLQDPNSLLLIASAIETGGLIGLIRFSVEGQTATLSYLLDASVRGRGWAAPLLLSGTRLVSKHFPAVKYIVGHVRQENTASIKAFHKAGYHEFAICPVPDITTTPGSVTFAWYC